MKEGERWKIQFAAEFMKKDVQTEITRDIAGDYKVSEI